MSGHGWIAWLDRSRWEAAWGLFSALLHGKRRDLAPRLGDDALAGLLLSADAHTCGGRQREVLITPTLCPPDGVGSCKGLTGCPFSSLRAASVDSPLARAFVYHLGPLSPAGSFPLGMEHAFSARVHSELRRSADLAGELEWPAIVSSRPTCYVCARTWDRGTARCPTCSSDLAAQEAWDREGFGAPLRKLLLIAFEETWQELTTEHQRLTALLLRARLRGMPFGTFPGAPTHLYLPSEARALVQHLDAVALPEDARPFGFQLRGWLWASASRAQALLVRG